MKFDFEERLKNKYPNEDLSILEYRTTKKPGKIKCNTCGKIYSFKQMYSAITPKKKNLCQDCGRREKIKKQFIQSLHDRFPKEKFELITFTTTQHPMQIKCLKCGTVYSYVVANSVKNKVHLCSKCFPQNNLLQVTIKNFIQFIQSNNDWEIITDLQTISSTKELIECKCLKCGKSNYKTIYDYMKGIHCACNRKKVNVNTMIQEICDKEEYQCLSLDKMNTYRDRIMLQHNCGYKYSVKVQNFINGYGRCPKCRKSKSNGELLIQNWLIKNNIRFLSEYPVILDGHILRMDFYLPDNDLYIEFQGRQHYEPIQFFGGEEKFKIIQEYDNLKRKYCQDRNNLLEISYKDIDNINSILSLKVQRPICTRKCEEAEGLL